MADDNKIKYETIIISIPDLKEAADLAKERLVADGMSEDGAKSRINKVWGLYNQRQYLYNTRTLWYEIVSPKHYLGGALYNMAKHQKQYRTTAEHYEAMLADVAMVESLTRQWAAKSAQIYNRGRLNARTPTMYQDVTLNSEFRQGVNEDTDFFLGEIGECQKRIREYLDRYPAQGRA